MKEFTHFNQDGDAIMVDVSGKEVTFRKATAQGEIKVNQEVMTRILHHTIEKGDVLGIARTAGIMATKKTSDLIPLCHPLFLNSVSISYELEEEKGLIRCFCTVKVEGKTGVEMEALTGATVCLLTVYDMCKAVDPAMELGKIYLTQKEGGKSGLYQRKEE